MRSFRTSCVYAILCLLMGYTFGWSNILFAQSKRPIEPSDCVTVRRFLNESFRASLQISPDGKHVAYLVNFPSLVSNENDVELDVASLDGVQPVRRLLLAQKVSGMHWLGTGDAISLLAARHGQVELLRVDVAAGHVNTLLRVSQDIAEYGIDQQGSTVVYAIERHTFHRPGTQATEAETASGYRIPFQEPSRPNFYTRDLFLVRKRGSGWTAPIPIVVRLKGVEESVSSFPYNLSLMLSVSPDGESLAFNYLGSAAMLPSDWQKSPVVAGMMTNGIGVAMVTAVIDLRNGSTSLPLPTPWSQSVPYWSPDSTSFIAVAESPVNSSWEKQDVQARGPLPDNFHLFEVHVRSGTVHLIREDLHGILRSPLAWKPSGELLLQTGANLIAKLREIAGVWQEISSRRLLLQASAASTHVAANDDTAIVDSESPAMPPSLLLYRNGWESPHLLVSLNPQFDHLTLAPVEDISWKTTQGFEASGLLFLPPGYDRSRRYPLVIHTYAATNGFFCDSGAGHYPAFAPQPIANAGMLYLIRIHRGGRKTDEERSYYPLGFPGNLAEAAFQTEIWDSAVETLTARGLVDPTKVGIIGFSRSGWYTEFALTHGRIRYAAATVVDNVEYSVGEYWLSHTQSLQRGWDAMYEGPPYGDTLKNWQHYSISFTLPKIRTPLLMEAMGYGTRYIDGSAPPLNLALKWEVFSGLSRLKKPTELYFYPLEMHQPDHPKARLGSLERNLAWYLFWLRGLERPDRSDPDRYIRWRAMREGMQDKVSTGNGLEDR